MDRKRSVTDTTLMQIQWGLIHQEDSRFPLEHFFQEMNEGHIGRVGV